MRLPKGRVTFLAFSWERNWLLLSGTLFTINCLGNFNPLFFIISPPAKEVTLMMLRNWVNDHFAVFSGWMGVLDVAVEVSIWWACLKGLKSVPVGQFVRKQSQPCRVGSGFHWNSGGDLWPVGWFPPEVSYESKWCLDSGSAPTRIQLWDGMVYKLLPQLFKRRD